MTAPHRRTYAAVLLLAALVLAAVLVAACSARASGGGTDGTGDGVAQGAATAEGPAAAPAGGSAVTGAKTSGTGDWNRVLGALASMRDTAPTEPVVVLLGGSAARESTIDDSSWREQIVARGGPPTLAWNLGSRNRTMAQNLAIVRALPRGADAIVFVGINLGSFTSSQKTATLTLPSPAPTFVEPEQPHQYSTRTGILSRSKKQTLVRQWLAKRYPVYKANFATSAAVLEKLVQVSKKRGYKPVLLELPRNGQVIGRSLSTPTARYRDRCRRLAAKYGIKWVPQLASLPNRDFYDLWHLVEPGRVIWQDKLSARTAYLLELYGFDGGGS
jgi:hypothetical protein